MNPTATIAWQVAWPLSPAVVGIAAATAIFVKFNKDVELELTSIQYVPSIRSFVMSLPKDFVRNINAADVAAATIDGPSPEEARAKHDNCAPVQYVVSPSEVATGYSGPAAEVRPVITNTKPMSESRITDP